MSNKSESILIQPLLFNNETISVKSKKAHDLAVKNMDKVKKWFKKYAKVPIPGRPIVKAVQIEGEYLRLVFDKLPESKDLNNYIDPDDDGNHPLKINEGMMLVSSKLQ